MSGSSGLLVKVAASSRVSHAIEMMTRLALISSTWKANSKACQGASNLYGLMSMQMPMAVWPRPGMTSLPKPFPSSAQVSSIMYRKCFL